jgi:hypothetical protein
MNVNPRDVLLKVKNVNPRDALLKAKNVNPMVVLQWSICYRPEGHMLCANNCKFFGSSTTRNMCSKCYEDLIMKEAQAFSAMVVVEKSFPTGSPMDEAPLSIPNAIVQQSHAYISPIVAIVEVSSFQLEDLGPSSSSSPQPLIETPNWCFSCKKQVGLTSFKCRCENTFCGLHRYAEKHSCSFDFKAVGHEAIAKANPVVKAAKIDKL